jgi:uncharacterized RDD family membrane protein YckC
MGTYSSPRRKKRSVADTLLEAEHEHYLDCPDADLPIRSAALLLDWILFSIATSGIHHLIETVSNSVPFLLTSFSQPLGPAATLAIAYFSWVIKTIAGYLYFIWSVNRFGGSPAKLIMGLRIVDSRTGQHLEYGQAFVREALVKPLGLFFLVGALTSVSRADRRSIHDIVTHSAVKRIRGIV